MSDTATMTDLGNLLISVSESPDDRLIIRFDPRTHKIYRGDSKYRTAGTILRGATLVQYVENPGNRTPTGGKFTSRRMTITYLGRRWVGQMKKGTDVVRLRPAPKGK
jgi:hypothetical protein